MMQTVNSVHDKDQFEFIMERRSDGNNFEWRGTVRLSDYDVFVITWPDEFIHISDMLERLRRVFTEALSDAILHPSHNH